MTDELADFYGELKDLDLTGKHFAVMGSGDKTTVNTFVKMFLTMKKHSRIAAQLKLLNP